MCVRHWSTCGYFVSSPVVSPAHVPTEPNAEGGSVVCPVLHVCMLCQVVLAGPPSAAYLPVLPLTSGVGPV